MRCRVLRRLIWVYTVCSGLSVRIYMVNTVVIGPVEWDCRNGPCLCMPACEHHPKTCTQLLLHLSADSFEILQLFFLWYEGVYLILDSAIFDQVMTISDIEFPWVKFVFQTPPLSFIRFFWNFANFLSVTLRCAPDFRFFIRIFLTELLLDLHFPSTKLLSATLPNDYSRQSFSPFGYRIFIHKACISNSSYTLLILFWNFADFLPVAQRFALDFGLVIQYFWHRYFL